MLHIIFQNQGIAPGVVMGIRNQNEPMSSGERAFIFESTRKALDEGWLPVKISNFGKPKKGGAG